MENPHRIGPWPQGNSNQGKKNLLLPLTHFFSKAVQLQSFLFFYSEGELKKMWFFFTFLISLISTLAAVKHFDLPIKYLIIWQNACNLLMGAETFTPVSNFYLFPYKHATGVSSWELWCHHHHPELLLLAQSSSQSPAGTSRQRLHGKHRLLPISSTGWVVPLNI